MWVETSLEAEECGILCDQLPISVTPPSLSLSACLPGGGDDEELSQKLEHCAQADFLRMVQWRI